MSLPSKPVAAAAGLVTGVVGLAASHAVVWSSDGGASPVAAVASVIRDRTPGRLAHELIKRVGHLDKPLLIAGTTLGVLALAVLAGLLARRRPILADVVFLLVAALGLLALRVEDEWTAVSVVAVVVGLVTWIVVLRLLLGSFLGEPAEGSRRLFLMRAGWVGVGAVAVAAGGHLLGGGRRKVEKVRRLLRLPVTSGAEPANTIRLPGLARFRTPNERFYRIDTLFSSPAISPHDWSLRIHGMVDREVVIGYEDLIGRKLFEQWVTICCVSNPVGGPLIGNAWWSGLPVRELLAQAGVHADADAVLQTSHDGWNCATPLTALTDDRNALLAVAMNGKPLPVKHGFPVRMIVPGLYGYVSATKWLVDLEVTRFDRVEAYWTQRGWSEKGPIKTESRIDVPRDGAQVPHGSLRIGGVAWAQHRGIEKVEFQLDGGPWRTAQLGGVPSVDTWVQWTGEVDLSPGDHTLVVRATDKDGHTQTPVQTDVIPDGATGWHTIGFSAT